MTAGTAARWRASVIGTVVAVALGGPGRGAAPASAQEPLVLASVTADGRVGNAVSGTFGVALSGDGSTVAFSSTATDLSPEDPDAEVDVYVKSLETGQLRLASTSSSGHKASTFSLRPSLDATGSTVAFLSAADDLHPDDTDGFSDVFVKDLASGELVLASTDRAGVKGAASSGPPDLSADGRRVAFATRARLVPEDTDTASDVYVKELESGVVHLASRRSDGSGAPAGYYGTGVPSLSGDGTRVAFDTDAALDPSDSDTAPDVYVKDLASGELLLASLTAEGGNSAQGSYRPSLSDDGMRVAFDSVSTDLAPEDPLEDFDVYVKDLRSGALLVASTTSSGTGVDGRATDASLSGDGRTVVFSSEAALGPQDVTVLQTWTKDLDTGAVELVSVDHAGAPAQSLTISPRVSADGTAVAFTTPAALLPVDSNGWADVYVRRLRTTPPPPPVDEEAPVVTLEATPEVLPAARRSVVRIAGSAVDGGSGLASLALTVCDEYGRVHRVLGVHVTKGQSSATGVRKVLLPGRSRAHDRDGREFTIWVTATDVAGNTARTHVHVVAEARHRHRGSDTPVAGGRGAAAVADPDGGKT